MQIYLEWDSLKTMAESKKLVLQFIESAVKYVIWAQEGHDEYEVEIYKSTPANADQIDFETNYKTIINTSISPISDDGKTMVRAESRPIGTTTWFTGAGDIAGKIGGGKEIEWDFSNNADIYNNPPAGYKQKRIEFNFIDEIYIKEGTTYFHNAIKGSYINFQVVCPIGQYYYDNTHTLKLAAEDIVISRYVNKQRFQGTCAMGDELNTEVCSGKVPPNYKFRIDIFVPDTDNSSNGYVSLELYRARTVIL